MIILYFKMYKNLQWFLSAYVILILILYLGLSCTSWVRISTVHSLLTSWPTWASDTQRQGGNWMMKIQRKQVSYFMAMPTILVWSWYNLQWMLINFSWSIDNVIFQKIILSCWDQVTHQSPMTMALTGWVILLTFVSFSFFVDLAYFQ